MKTIVFANQKGGVGRTTVSGNVAASLAAENKVAWVTTADCDWSPVSGLTVFGSTLESLRQAVSDAGAATSDGVLVVDLPPCDLAVGWWTGEADVVLVSDGEASSLFGALQTARAWGEAGKNVVGFVLVRVPEGAFAEDLGRRLRKTIAQFTNMDVPHICSVPLSNESASLANLGSFCAGKAAAPYRATAKRLLADRSAAEPAQVLQGLKERREALKAA